MSGIQQKISSHAKKKETMTHNKQKNQSIESDKELTWVLELAGDINIVICTLFHLHKKLNRDIESKEKNLNRRLDIIEEKISAFEDISIETIQKLNT